MIQATCFDRSIVGRDDHAWTSLGDNGLWNVYCSFGPTWFWNFETEQWVLVSDDKQYAGTTMARALSVLATCQTKKQGG